MTSRKTNLLFVSDSQYHRESIQKFTPDPVYYSPFFLVADKNDLWSHLKNDFEQLVFFAPKYFELNDRIFLKKLNEQYPDLKIVFCSKAEFALDAWNFNLFQFLAFPITHEAIQRTIKKHLTSLNQHSNKRLILRDQQKITQWDPNHLLYCKGGGNYSELLFINGSRMVVTRKLKELESFFSPFPGIERVGKSFIINLKSIKALQKNTISFLGSGEEKLILSDTYIKRIKCVLFGIE